MRKFICVLLVVLLIVPSFCYADASYLRWGMSKSDVFFIMGETKDIVEKGELIILGYYDQTISAYTANMGLLLRNNALFSRIYMLEDNANKAKYTYLCNALESKYGIASCEDILSFYEVILFMSGTTDISDEQKETANIGLQKYAEMGLLKTWKISRDTCVGIIFMSSEFFPDITSPQTVLVYFQPLNQTQEYNFEGL